MVFFGAQFDTATLYDWGIVNKVFGGDGFFGAAMAFAEMVENPQIKHNNMILEYEHPTVGKVRTTGFPVSFSDTSMHIYHPSPFLNEHAGEILKQYCNYNDFQVNEFLKWIV